MPVALVSRLKCHCESVSRNSSPVVAASVGVASIGLPDVVWSEYLITCSRWMPERTVDPPQAAVNLTGMVLFSLKVGSGLVRLPPVASAPPTGARNPVKAKIEALTVTVNEPEAVLPDASCAVQLTVVTPAGNTEPEGGLQVTLTPGQLSVALAAKLTTAEDWPHGTLVTMFAGQVTTGFSVSFTVTVKLQVEPSPAVQLTVVVPFGKVEPGAGVHVTLRGLPHSSAPAGVV